MAFLVLCAATWVACGRPSPQKAQLPGDSRGASPGAAAVQTPGEAETPAGATDAASRPAVPPGPPPGWPACELVTAGNLDGEGDDEVLCWSQGQLSVWAKGEEGPYEVHYQVGEGEEKLPGAPNVMTMRDLDGDGRDDVLLGFGLTRGQLEVPVTVAVLRLKGEPGMHRRTLTTLYQATSPRPQVTGLAIADLDGDHRAELLLSYFDSKYFVRSFALSLLKGPDPVGGMLPARPLARVRMATSVAAGDLDGDARAEVLIGRPYGEEKLAPGDLFVQRGEQRDPIPSQLGVRSVTIGDGDGDGRPEVYFGDGWHFEYGKKARGRLSVARSDKSGWKTELIEQTPGQYEIKKIQIDDVDWDHRPEVLAAGDRYIGLFWKTPQGWMKRRVADGEDFAVARLGGVKTLVVPGAPIRLVPLSAGREGGQPVEPAPASSRGVP